MSLYNRLGLNFDTSNFGDAQALSGGAANTLNLISSSSGGIPDWQVRDLAAGTPVRSNYFQNPVTSYIINISSAANTLISAALSANDFTTAAVASSLVVELTKFQSHTDNISGVSIVTNNQYPSFQSAQNIGQLNMMTLAKTDGVSNTAGILGSFTSLFIKDSLSSNANTILKFSTAYANSVANVSGNLVSNLANTDLVNIQSYLTNTQIYVANSRTNDWSFYQNSVQLAKDIGFMQQFNNLGGTASYLMKNLVGTQRLLSNTSITTVGAGAVGSVTGSTVTNITPSTMITTLGVVTLGTWNASVIDTTYGGTGLSSFNQNGAVYATTANTLTTGTLPVIAGGTGVKSSTGSGSVVLSSAPALTNATLTTPSFVGQVLNIAVTNIVSTNTTSNNIVASSVTTVNTSSINVTSNNITVSNIAVSNITFSNTTTGNIIPSVASTYNLGSANNRWANVYTSDLNLSNEKLGGNSIDGTTGNWTVQEGENDLFIINNKTGKKYKFSLEEL